MAEQFIKQIASYVIKYAPQYGIMVYSPIIAQAILESAKGTSNKVKVVVDGKIEWRHNYFGLKWRNNRCAISNEYFEEWTAEQLKDGTYQSIVSKFCKFNSMEDCVIGYFQWTNIPNYANLKGVTDPKTYLENIKTDKYATSLNYVDDVMAVIKKYNLTQYDRKELDNMGKIIALGAGHGLTTSGKEITLSGYDKIKEWWLNDRISDRIEILLSGYDCKVVRVGDTTGKKDISLEQRIKTANNINADVYISVHHNAGIKGKRIGYKGKLAGGTVVFYYSSKAEHKAQAQSLYNEVVSRTGLVGDRATPVAKQGFYVLKNTKMPAFLIENGFMDSPTDVPIILSEEHAEKTAQGIVAFLVKEYGLQKKQTVENKTEELKTEAKKLYRVQVGAFSKKPNATKLKTELESKGYKPIIVES